MERILLLVEGAENRRLLAETLGARYEVVADSGSPAGFDLALVDAASLARAREWVALRRSETRPVALPFLLIAGRTGTAIPPPLRELVDDLIRPPVEKAELLARVETLLRIRRLSLELKRRAENLSERLGRVLDDSPDAIFICDAETLRFVQVNGGACRDLGYTAEELAGMTPLDLQPGLTRQEWERVVEPLRTGERPQVVHEAVYRRQDGSELPVELRVQLSRAETPPVFVVIAQDITERRRAEHEIQAAHERALQAESERKVFSREILRSVTQGRFLLVDRGELPDEGKLVLDLPVQEGSQYGEARTALRQAAAEAGMPQERVEELILAAGEAIGNALKHAIYGRCQLFRSEDALIVRVCDRGTGIRWQDIPASILTAGFSTKISLGVGYTLMLQLADQIWLSTGEDGTIVQLRKCLQPVPEPDEAELLLAALDRF